MKGRTDEGAKRPVTRRARLLAARCARYTLCAQCAVSWHRNKLTCCSMKNWYTWR